MRRTQDLDLLAEALDRAASWLRRTARPTDWNSVAMSTLDAVERTGPLRVSDLVALEHITQPGMTGLIARLEAAGLVERGSDPSDGRATLVAITDTGRTYLREFHAKRAASIAAHLRTLPAAELEALLGASDALALLASQPIIGEDPHS
ncbi:MAG TPA: MarR family transcriptional regulator [Micromonosporaceae bacterium]